MRNTAAALAEWIYYGIDQGQTSNITCTRQKHRVNNALRNDCLYPQHFTPINYNLSTLHLCALYTQTQTNKHTKKKSACGTEMTRRASCKRSPNTCHNKKQPASEHKGKYRQSRASTHSHTHTHLKSGVHPPQIPSRIL